jgi:hypothetical protein
MQQEVELVGNVLVSPISQTAKAATWRRQLGGFWLKINRDWMFNLASMLAYTCCFPSSRWCCSRSVCWG